MRIETDNPQGTRPVGGPAASPAGGVSAADSARRTGVDPPVARTQIDDEVAAALRRFLPRQGSPATLLANLEWLATTRDGARAPLPSRVRGLALDLWQAVSRVEELATTGRLERAGRESGVHLERRLSTVAPTELAASLPRDCKALLLRLRAALADASPRLPPPGAPERETPLPGRPGPLTALPEEAPTLPGLEEPAFIAGELLRGVTDSLARITCDQLASIPGASGVPALCVELPLRRAGHAVMLRLRVHRDAAAESAGRLGYCIEFAVDLGAAGSLSGAVRERAGRMDVTLDTGTAAFAAALQAAASRLEHGLAAIGFALGRLTIRIATAPDTPRDSNWLVDLRA